MANFSVVNTTGAGSAGVQQAMTTTYKTLAVVAASTTAGGTYIGLRRGKLYDILVGTNGTPADNYMEFDAATATYASSTAITTGGILGLASSLSSNYALDPADGPSNACININSSVETYLTAPIEKWYVGINQRASYRWVAAPGSEFVYPAVSSGTGLNGYGIRARSGGYTGTATVTLLFQEQ